MEYRKSFETRLKSLQRLCSNNDSQYPASLLFISGPDGRNNKGSQTILKYLFDGSINKDLNDGVLDETLEILEECVLLIQESTLSIVYTMPIRTLLMDKLIH